MPTVLDRLGSIDTQVVMTTEPLDVRDVIAAGGATEWNGMPARTTLGHLHLHVGSLDGAETFYHRGIGLDKTLWSYPGALFLSAGAYHHHLVRTRGRQDPPRNRTKRGCSSGNWSSLPQLTHRRRRTTSTLQDLQRKVKVSTSTECAF